MVVVALVGANGNFGHKLVPILAAEESITEVRCLSRGSSTESSANKVSHFKVDYSNPEELKKVLKGCDVLINAMGTNLDHLKNKVALVDAAAEAGVTVYIPRSFASALTYLTCSEFGVDPHVDTEFVRHPMWDGKKEHDAYAESKGLKVISI